MFENLQKYKINFFFISKKTDLGQPKKWARTTKKMGPVNIYVSEPKNIFKKIPRPMFKNLQKYQINFF